MTTHTPGRKIGSMVSAAEYGDLLIHCDSLREINAELLAALQLAVATIQRLNPTGSSTGGTIDVANAAIAKATQI